jgi:hypothetical protein
MGVGTKGPRSGGVSAPRTVQTRTTCSCPAERTGTVRSASHPSSFTAVETTREPGRRPVLSRAATRAASSGRDGRITTLAGERSSSVAVRELTSTSRWSPADRTLSRADATPAGSLRKATPRAPRSCAAANATAPAPSRSYTTSFFVTCAVSSRAAIASGLTAGAISGVSPRPRAFEQPNTATVTAPTAKMDRATRRRLDGGRRILMLVSKAGRAAGLYRARVLEFLLGPNRRLCEDSRPHGIGVSQLD